MDLSAQPVRYIGSEFANTDYHDGQLRPVVGVHHIQVLRANRTHPEMAEDMGWTYNHAPMLAYWNKRFYLEYLSNPVGEHIAPGQTLLTTSADGLHWDKPVVIFPIRRVPEGVYRGPYPLQPGVDAIMHQRMGFYTAPDGRLLILGFYGCSPTTLDMPNDGWGIGRVVREAYRDGSFGPIYFLRYNRHAGWNESNTFFPFYKQSPDGGFVAACEALLADKLATLQWWEEDRSQDGFYAVPGYKALSYYHLPDGRVVGLWKWSKAAITADEGKTWTPVADVPSLVMAGAKIWGQRTSDGRYALVYNPSPDGEHRWPLAIVTSDDGVNFDKLRLVSGEVPPRRFIGTFKDFGQNYVRGICEGDGVPPDGALWIAYSMNKEDIWVTRVPVPVTDAVAQPVNDTFNNIPTGGLVSGWNIYSPRWAKASVIDYPSSEDKSLELRDEDPYDYAKAERIFPESTRVTIEMSVMCRERVNDGQLQIEVADPFGNPGARIVFDSDGGIKGGHREYVLAGYRPQKWYKISLGIDTVRHGWTLSVDGNVVLPGDPTLMPIRSVSRLIVRTGDRRREPTLDSDRFLGGDLPHADDKALPVTFCVNYVKTSGHELL